MIKWGFIVLSILLLVGCSSKEEKTLMKEYKKKKSYFKKLQKTEKIMLTHNNITKAVLTAQYISSNSNTFKDDSNETFIIGLYLEDEEIESLRNTFGLRKKGKKKEVLKAIYDKNASHEVQYDEFNMTIPGEYRLTLNGEKALSIQRLSDSDKRLKNLALKSEWTIYSLVRFKHSKNNLMKLKFESSLYGVGKAKFSKVAKYVDAKRVF